MLAAVDSIGLSKYTEPSDMELNAHILNQWMQIIFLFSQTS